MNELSGGEAMVRMLQAHDVRHVFGLCGDTSLPFYDALYRLDHGITHILTRDERHAGYMADAYARVTGRPGVCEGPSGGGATYILPGIVEANESCVPVLGITSDISVGGRGRYVLTELDQEALFRPLTKWNAVIDRADQLPRAVRRAFREMTTGRPGAVHLGLPFDVQKEPVDEADVWADEQFALCPALRTAAEAGAIDALVAALEKAERPLLIAGGGVVISGAMSALERLAEHFGMAVATTISGQGSIAEDHPLAVGVVGSNGGTPATRGLVDEADLVFFVGCRAGSVTTERWRHPRPGAVTVAHLDIDPAVIGANYPTGVALAGDVRLTLEAALHRAAHRGGQEPRRDPGPSLRAALADKAERFEALARADDRPIVPERVIAALQAVLPDDAVIVADPGTPCPYFSAHYLQRKPGRHFISNRAHGALGYSLGAVVGAAVGRPKAKCVAVMGDGSFAMACGEMETIRRLGLPVTLIVISNGVFGWIKAGQRSGFDGRYFSVDFGESDHARIAEAFGLKAFRVEDPAELTATLKKAVNGGVPTLVDIVCQPLHEAAAPVSEWVA